MAQAAFPSIRTERLSRSGGRRHQRHDRRARRGAPSQGPLQSQRRRRPRRQRPSSRVRPGVYFNLPMADYHADPSLGSTDLKALLRAPSLLLAAFAHEPRAPRRQRLAGQEDRPRAARARPRRRSGLHRGAVT